VYQIIATYLVIPRSDEERLPLPRTMLGPLVLNTLALARWVGQSAASPQYYPRGDRPSYRDQAGDYPSSRGGDYRMYGALAGPGDTAAFIEPGTRGRAGYYGASNYRGQETCPYDNEKLLRRKRSVNETESVLLGRLKRQSYDGLSYSEYRSRNYRGYGGRYDDYRGRYDDYSRGYGRRYGDREDGGRGRYDDRFNYGRDSGRVRTYPCGREICTWTAELECNLQSYNSFRGYDRVEWRREHDGYYPRDTYRDLMHYCGGRCSLQDNTLVISEVRPEDKGVYRCYREGGDQKEFAEVTFYPKFPLSSNDDC